MLTRRINEGKKALKERLNESFAAVGKRLDALPAIAMLQFDAQASNIIPCFGCPLLHLDIMRMRPVPLTDDQRANSLIGHLDGVTREKMEGDGDSSRSYCTIVSHLTELFESPQQRLRCSSKIIGMPLKNRRTVVFNLARAATSGKDSSTHKERVLEESLDRLRGDTRYFVSWITRSPLSKRWPKLKDGAVFKRDHS
ncbi:hypothetical protein COOONC_15228 [Cooperia oncophora]